MEEIKAKDEEWRKYEKEICNNLEEKFPDCSIAFDDSIFGLFSKIDRQVDISIRGEVAGNKILGVVDCKFYSKRIDIKAVESFLGMLEDLNANIGIMVTNCGYSKAAINRASVKNLKLEIVKLDQLYDLEINFDAFFNNKIRNLRLSKFEFFKRLKDNWIQFDEANSSYTKRIISFKKGFAYSEFDAHKRIIKESARIFRDFPEMDQITVQIPAKKHKIYSDLKEEFIMYRCTISRSELETFLNLDFWELRQDIKKWRTKFLENKNYTKDHILNFANKYITSFKLGSEI